MNEVNIGPKQMAVPVISNRLLNPIERVSEIIFGLIMTLTFTCALSVAEADRKEIRFMLVGAIGCNIAWGLIDAVMFIIIGLTQKGRNLAILNYVRNSADADKSREFIAEALPAEFQTLIGPVMLNEIRTEFKKSPDDGIRKGISGKDFKMSLGIFLLVFLSTFPVAIPFIFIPQAQYALRVSNFIAVILLFLCGWILGRYGSYNKFLMGLILACIGSALVLVTISLGG